jgi:phospholipid/cholesterol/gamma-HCH transport system substrate-binding protein
MMRSRTLREGSVGLLILGGLALFGWLILWLRGLSLGSRSYHVFLEFPSIPGLESGAAVRFRGVTVGKVVQTRPGPNGVEVEVEISPADLIIPKNVKVEASQSGLLGSTYIEITPTQPLVGSVSAKPLDPGCNSNVIVCNKDRLRGETGVSIDELIRSATRFADVYSSPQFFANLNSLAKNSAEAASEVTKLSREFGEVAKVTRRELGTFSQSAQAVTVTANKLGLTADQVNSILSNNRSSLISTLDNINQITSQLRVTTTNLNPIVTRLQQGELLRNLEVLSANAAAASANLRDVSKSLNSPANLLALQQTLDSARATFQNAQKITADLDELTGDPTFRVNLRKLVNGLSNLVSSTQQLHQQAQFAQFLAPLATDPVEPAEANRGAIAQETVPPSANKKPAQDGN